MIGTILKQTQSKYGIRSKLLAETSGLGTSAISNIRRGATDPTWSTVVRLLEGLDCIAPGSRRYFCKLLAGVNEDDRIPVQNLDDEELAQLLVDIGRELQTRRSTVAKVLVEA